MRESSSDFRDTLLELIDSSPEPMNHPSADQWLAYHRGELSEDEETRLQEHLVRCRDCFELSEAASAFAAPDGEPDAGEEAETAALWRGLRPQLDPSPPPANVREISSGPRRRRPSWRFRLPTILAASFFAGLVGLTAWNLQLRSALEALRAPQPDAPIVDFAAGERLSSSAETTLSRPSTLVFNPNEELPVYRLALRDAETDREMWSLDLRPDEDFALTLQISALPPPGRYRLELSGGGRVLETHLVRVTEPGEGD